MRRVTRGPIVLLTFDNAAADFWLTEYVPELLTLDDGRMPVIEAYERWLGPVEITPVPIPHDCSDGFLCAYWRRPRGVSGPPHPGGDVVILADRGCGTGDGASAERSRQRGVAAAVW